MKRSRAGEKLWGSLAGQPVRGSPRNFSGQASKTRGMIAGNEITVKVSVPKIYHSNEKIGSGEIGRSWPEFCSLVRRGKGRG